MTQHQDRATSKTWAPRGEHIERLTGTGLGERVSFKTGQLLFAQGELDPRFYVLLSGKVHVYTLSDEGHESILNIMGPGSLIGEGAALSGQPRLSTARALEPSEAVRLQVAHLERYVVEDPKFAVALLCTISVKQRQLVDRLKQVVNDGPDRRILRFLHEVAKTQSRPDADLTTVQVNLTHEQIGNLTDLSRVTVTRTLNRLRKSGAIEMVGRSILVRPPDWS